MIPLLGVSIRGKSRSDSLLVHDGAQGARKQMGGASTSSAGDIGCSSASPTHAAGPVTVCKARER